MTHKMAASVYVVVLLVTLTLAQGPFYDRVNIYSTYDKTTDRFQIHQGYPTEDSLAWAQFINAVNVTGWGFLEVNTIYAAPDNVTDSMKAYAAGLVEGYITRDLITQHWKNTRAGYCEEPYSPYCQRLRDFLQANLNWVRKSIRKNPDDPYWHQVEMFYTQLKGLSDGYNNDPKTPSLDIDPFGLYMFQISDDLGDLETALHKPGVQNKPHPGHCSALVKIDEYKQLLVAHNTWTSYSHMVRVLKRYNLRYAMTDAKKEWYPPGIVWTFSSYPGYLVSSDDFHVLSSYMVTMETTIPNNNPALYKRTKPKGCLFEPVRVWVANRVAASGEDWVMNFTRYNSGTYNNQWMVVDQKMVFDKLLNGTLTVVEQMPTFSKVESAIHNSGYVQYADVTDTLRKDTYWASYNVAYFPKIFNISGQQAFVEKYGDYFTHDMCRRAQIFRRDQSKVKDRQSMFKLMSYNNFTQDPLSRCNCTPPYSADLAIAARADLNSETGNYPFEGLGFGMGGAVDLKMVATSDMQWQMFDAISGPTYQQQPPFQWSKVKDQDKYPHFGQPDIFNFKPYSFNGTQTPPYVPSWYNPDV